MSFRLLMALALLGTLSEGFNAPGRGEFIGKWHGIRLLLRAGETTGTRIVHYFITGRRRSLP